MERGLKRLLSVLIVLTMVLSMVPAVEVSAATGTVWSGGSFSDSGSYYLTKDVTISSEITIASDQNITLDLNGNTVTVAEGTRGFMVKGKLTIKDSGTGGTITGSSSDYTGRGGIFYVNASGAVLTLESGTITGGRSVERGGNIYVEKGTFNMTGGTVSNGYAGDRGGNICSTGTVKISGGTVSNGYAGDRGGNICSTGTSKVIYISGDALITEGTSKRGGNVFLVYSTLNMSGGTISNGSATLSGGNLDTYSSDTARSSVTVSGGSILDAVSGSTYSMRLAGTEEMPCLVNISGGVLEGTVSAELTTGITLSGAPVIEHLLLGKAMIVTPTDLREGADICVSTTSGYSTISGLLTNAESYLPYFSACEPGYIVDAVNNVLTMVPACSCGCGMLPEEVEWKSLSGYTGGELAGGHYYVPTGGVTLTEQFTVAAGVSVTVDLRGNTLKAADTARAFEVNGVLNILDTTEAQAGILQGGTVSGARGGTIRTNTNAVLSLFSGTITGGSAERGGNIYADASSTFNMYGGTVTDGIADQSLTTSDSTTNGRGGNIFLNNATANLVGGLISGGQALNAKTTYAGNLMIMGSTKAVPNPVKISGDLQIIGGTAKKGSSVALCYATVTMTGGSVEDGTVYMYASGGVYSTLHLSDAYIDHLFAHQVAAVNLSGAVKIDRLELGTDMHLNPNGLTEGAQICLDAAEGAVSGALENAEAEKAYFTAYDSGFVVDAVEDTLYYGTGCACGCGALASNITWKSWSGTAITASGHYKLSKAATLPSVITVAADVDMVIDLNGKTLTAPSEDRAFVVNGSLTVLDSVSGGKITGGAPTSGDGGNITVSGGVFNLRSGTITGGYAPRYGGNIVVNTSGVFNMYGGTITGGSAGERGGNIYKGTGTMYMYGGTVTGGTCPERGGNLFATNGSVYMTGGTISNGTAAGGNNVMLTGMDTSLHISGTARVTAGTATTGSNIGLIYSNLYVSGGTIDGGTINATESGNLNHSGLYFSGGTINCTTITAAGTMDDNRATLIAVTGGTFSGTFEILSASNVILSGAPVGLKLDLATGVRVTPVDLEEGTVITLTAAGPFTTQLTNGDDYIQYFTATSGNITNDADVLTVIEEQAKGDSGKIHWVLTTDGTLTLTGTGAMNNYSTTSVPWRSYLTSIKKVVVGEGITTLGNYAFYDCTNLKTVEIASTVTTIGTYTFRNCTSLTSVELPSKLTSVGTAAFINTGLTEITLPNSLTTIGNSGFQNCASLETVTLGTGITTVGTNAFSGCDALTTVYYKGTSSQWSNVTVNSGNTALTGASNIVYSYSGGTVTNTINWNITGGNTLNVSGTGEMPGYYRDTAYSDLLGAPWRAYAGQITKVVITGFTSVGEWAFYNLDKLTSVSISSTVTRIEANAFRDCDALTTITIPNSVTLVGESAFQSCGKLKTVTLGSKVNTVGSFAFYDCTALTGITIPAAVKTIGTDAFGGCAAMTAFTVNDSNTAYQSVSGALLNKSGDTLIRVPSAYSGSYTTPTTVTTVGANAFADCTAITDVVLTEKVTTVEAGAFFGSSVTTVTLGTGIISIADTAFNDCADMTAFICSGNKTYFTDASGVLYTYADVKVGDEIVTKTVLFQVPGGISGEYTVANTVDIVGKNALAWNQKLTRVNISGSVETVDTYAFTDTALTVVDMTSNTTAIKKGAFESAAVSTVNYLGTERNWAVLSVEAANDPFLAATVNRVTGGVCNADIRWDISDSGVLTITGTGELPAYAESLSPWYNHGGGITSIVIGEGITGISAKAFYGCSNVTEVTLPASLMAVGESAFATCSALSDANYAGTAFQWKSVTVASGNDNLTGATFHCEVAQLTQLTIMTMPTKLNYLMGETLDTTGLVLLLTYNDGFTEEVSTLTEEYAVTADLTKAGTATVTITYKEKTVDYTVNVAAAGSCGENVNWKLVDGVLTLYGTGEMTYYDSKDLVPWWNLKETITSVVVEEGVTGRLSRYAFYDCSNMKTVSLPEGITSIGSSAFNGCSSLKEIKVPDSVTKISSTAFGGNTALTTISIGEGLTTIGAGAFKTCTNLTTVNYGGSRTTWDTIAVEESDNEAFRAATVNYARVDVTSLEITAQPNKTAYLLGEQLDTEGMEITAHKDDGTSAVVTDYTVSADMSAVGNVTVTVSYGGKTAELPISIGYGGYTADGLFWQYADGVLSVDYVVDEENPGTGMMLDYTAEVPAPWATLAEEIENLVIGEGVTVVGTYAFAGCTALTAVVLPDSLTEVRGNAFLNCQVLETVTFAGEEEKWDSIQIAETGNETLLAIAPKAEAALGDINGDGSINSVDLVALQAYVIRKTDTIDFACADINGDGSVNSIDLVALQAYVIRKTDSLG